MDNQQTPKPPDIMTRNRELIYSRMETFASALGSATKAEQFAVAAANDINADANLQACTDASKMSCLLQICQWGLMPGKSKGHIFLVPFKNAELSKAAGRDIYEATIIPGYKGYLELAYRSGLPLWIQSNVVYEKDTFEYIMGTEAKLTYAPSNDVNRGKRLGVYLLIEFKAGKQFIDYMPATEIEPVKAFALASKRGGFSPWSGKFEDEMWIKTIIRRASKLLNLGEAFKAVAEFETEFEQRIAEEQEHDLPYPRTAVMVNATVLESVEGTVGNVTSETKLGKKGKADYELYTITLDGGLSLSTFNDYHGQLARDFWDSGETVLIEYQKTNYGPKLLNIVKAQ